MADEPSRFRERFRYALHVIPGGSLLFALIPLVIFGYLGWYYYAAERIDRTFYSLKSDQIQISTQPDWIKSNVLQEVYETKRLDRINLLDPSSNADIASAFETHPWVRSATRVRKLSGTVSVDLVYRQPVAMIQVPYQDPETQRWKQGFYPVDSAGVVLPVGDFSEAQVFDYLKIDIESIDRTPTGMAYADVRVLEALKLTAFLESTGRRKDLGLQWLNVRRDDDASTGRQWILQLRTTDNRMIVWGHAPGAEVPGEETPDMKVTAMGSWLSEQRAKGSEGGLLDLLRGSSITGQTASFK